MTSKQFPREKAVLKSLIRPHRHIDDSKWVRQQTNELSETYPDMWIAVLDKEVVIASKDLGEVYRVGRQKAAHAGTGPCVYTFVESFQRARGRAGIRY